MNKLQYVKLLGKRSKALEVNCIETMIISKDY